MTLKSRTKVIYMLKICITPCKAKILSFFYPFYGGAYIKHNGYVWCLADNESMAYIAPVFSCIYCLVLISVLSLFIS